MEEFLLAVLELSLLSSDKARSNTEQLITMFLSIDSPKDGRSYRRSNENFDRSLNKSEVELLDLQTDLLLNL